MGKSDSDRITELEIQLAHLQRTYDQLNEVVTEQALRLDQMVAAKKQQDAKIDRLLAAHDEQSTDPLDEKPPHY